MKLLAAIVIIGSAVLVGIATLALAKTDRAKTDCQPLATQEVKQAKTDCPTIDDAYQVPTFIGADPSKQQALFERLSNKTELSLIEQRQWLLVQLALLANNQETSLSQLESLEGAISDYLINNKTDIEILTAKGSVIALQSLHFQDNLGKMNFLSRKGMRLMDRAVKQAPNHLGARLLRGLSYANMPAFLNRASFAKEDLTLVKQHIPATQNPGFIEFVDHYLEMATAKTQGASQ